MLGVDTSDVKEKLEKYTGIVDWTYLEPHFRNQVLLFVDPQLQLADVGYAISSNNTQQVEAWLKSGDLVKISALHAAQWEKGETHFEALVVSPFVLCRPL